MREYLTPDDICNQISMNRTLFKGTVLLSEGNTDQRLYQKFIDDDVRIIPAHSKSNVINVSNKMAARRDSKVMGIVDRDLDDLKGKKVNPPLFYTDHRDMEMMLIISNAIDDVLIEYADKDRLARFVKQYGEIRDVVISAAFPIGVLMYLSYLRGYNLNFKNLDFKEFIDRRTLSVDVSKMVQAVVDNTAGCEINKRGVIKDLQTQCSSFDDKEKLARGHDSVDILLIGLRDAFGSYNAGLLNVGAVGGALRLAYDANDFKKTKLYADSKRWAESRGLKLWAINRCRSPRS